MQGKRNEKNKSKIRTPISLQAQTSRIAKHKKKLKKLKGIDWDLEGRYGNNDA